MDIVYQLYESCQNPDDIKQDPFMLNQRNQVNGSEDELMRDMHTDEEPQGDTGPNPWQVMSDPRYRCATWIGMMLACFN